MAGFRGTLEADETARPAGQRWTLRRRFQRRNCRRRRRRRRRRLRRVVRRWHISEASVRYSSVSGVDVIKLFTVVIYECLIIS